jgi:WD40 repeat protein/tetratricopeptide (TPR) repeat protein
MYTFMNDPQVPGDTALDNEESLNTLARAIALDRGQFSLILVRCNYADVQQAMQQRLRELCSFEIRELILPKSAKTLYTAIKDELGNQQPDALMVMGLEAVTDLDDLLSATNQVRDEFRKSFAFPLVLWVNDEVLRKLVKVAPDFNNWTGVPIHFAIATASLVEKLKQNAERVFAAVLDARVDQFLPNCAILGANYPCELNSALMDLQSCNIKLEPELEASVEFLRGRDQYGSDRIDAALAHYQQSLAFWQQRRNLERTSILLFHIGLCWLRRAELEYTKRRSYWEEARGYLQQAIDDFETAGRIDLVVKFITQLGEVLRRLEAWEELRTLARKSLRLHQAPRDRVYLAQDYSFLAEVALKGFCVPPPENCAEQAHHFALEALHILSEVPEKQQRQRSLYELLLALSQQNLGEPQEAILTLEAARARSNPQDNPQLYIDILAELRSLYFQQSEYLKAFRIKQEQRAIEAQYGFRAFIGAGRLQPQRQAKSVLGQVEPPETIPPEIAASGRQLDINRLVERMTRDDCKLTVMHGFSGVGKSSILLAGLVPTLKEKEIGTREALPIVLQVYSNWERALGKLLAEGLKEKSLDLPLIPDSAAAIVKQLQKNEAHHLLTVLIFDQFEEFFFDDPAQSLRKQFFEFLRDCLTIPYVKVILSLREDYLHYLLECERLTDLKRIDNDILNKQNRHYIGNFSQKDAELVITSLTERSQFYLEPALIQAVVKDLARELGEVRPIELQIVGAQLQAENITTLAEYERNGPKEKLVERYVGKVVEDCGYENKEIAQAVLYLLTDENGIRPLKTREQIATELSDLLEDSEKLDLVLEIFVSSGLVFLFPEVHTDSYQLVHDYLVSFVRPEDNELKERLAQAREKLAKEREQRKLTEAELNRVEEVNRRLEEANRRLAEVIEEREIEKEQRNLTEAELNRVEEVNRKLAEVIEELEQEREQRKSTEVELNRAEEVLADVQKKTKRTIRAGSAGLAAISVLATTVVAWTGITARQNIQEKQEGTRIERAGASALRQFEFTQIKALLSAMKSGQDLKNLVKDGRPLEEYPATSPLFALQTILDNIHERNQFSGHQSEVYDVSLSPDEQRLVTVTKDGIVRFWSRSGQLLHQWDSQQGEIYSVKFSPNGQRIVTAGQDGTARVWDLSGEQLAQLKGHQGAVASVDFDSKGQQRIATVGADGTVRLWNLSGQQLTLWNGKDSKGKLWDVSFSRNGQRLATAGEDGTVRLWNLSGNELAQLKGHQKAVFSVSFSPDGQLLATAGLDGTVRLWNLSGQLLDVFNTSQPQVTSVSFVSDKQLVTTGTDSTVRLWDLSGRQLAQLKGHQGWVYSASLSRDGRYLATAGQDGTTRLWNLSGQKQVEWQAYTKNPGWNVVSFSPDGKRLATAGVNDRTVRLWDLLGQQLTAWKTEQNGIESISFSRDGQYLATAADDGTVRLWNRSRQLIARFDAHQGKVYSVNFSPDGQRLATAGADGKARLWNLSGQQITQFDGHQGNVYSVNFSPDGQRFATAGEDGKARLWNLLGQQITQFGGHQGNVYSVNFSPDGQYLATAGEDDTARLWDLSGQQITQFDGHQGKVYSVKFSPDGQRLATAGADGTVRLWSLSGQQVAQFDRPHKSEAFNTSFSPDGQSLATVGADGIVQLWKVEDLDELLAKSCQWLKDYFDTHPQEAKVCQRK